VVRGLARALSAKKKPRLFTGAFFSFLLPALVAILDDGLFFHYVGPTVLLDDDLVTRLSLADNFLFFHDAIWARTNSYTGTNRSDAHADTDFFSDGRCGEGRRRDQQDSNTFHYDFSFEVTI
jgi:hypothetical protein